MAEKKVKKLTQVKEAKEEDKRSMSDDDSGEDDNLNRSMCSISNEALDNDFNHSDEEDSSARVRGAKMKKV